MRYRTLCKTLMDAYPTLFINEDDVLRHLFFVIGNGYEWVDGELVDVRMGHATPEEMIRTARSQREPWREDYQKALADCDKSGLDGSYYREQLANLDAPAAFMRKKERAHRIKQVHEGRGKDCWFIRKDGSLGSYLYPLSEYARILHVPAEVKPDWLKAARAAYHMAMAHLRSHRSNGDPGRDRAYLRLARVLLATFPKGRAR
jgi:hypothetical protein